MLAEDLGDGVLSVRFFSAMYSFIMPHRFKSRRRMRRKKRSGHTAGQAYQLARKAYRLTDHELLNKDTLIDAAALTLPGAVNMALVNTPTRGTGPLQYQGRKYWMTHLDISALVRRGTGAADGTPDWCRLMCVYDKVPNGVDFVIDQLLDPVALGSGNTDVQLSAHYALNSIKRFTVLYDIKFAMDFFHPKKIIKRRIQINKNVVTTSSLGTIADIEIGAVFFLFMSSVSGVTAQPTMSGDFRLRFRK